MRLIQGLSRLSMDRLRSIVQSDGINTRSLSKQHVISAINARFQQPAFLTRLWEQLDYELQMVMGYLLRYRTDTFNWDDLVHQVATSLGTDHYEEAANILEDLCDRGLLLKFTDSDPPVAVVPRDLADQLRTITTASGSENGLDPCSEPAQITSGKATMTRNLLHLAALASRERLRLTKHETLFRRAQERVEQLAFRMDVPGLLSDRPEEYPSGPDLLVELGLQRKLLHAEDEELRPGARLAEFIASDVATATRSLYHLFEGNYVDNDAHLSFARALLADPVATGGWFDVGALLARVLGSAYDKLDSNALTRHQNRIRWFFEAAWAFGLVDLGQDSEGNWSLRCTPLGCYVLADGPAVPDPDPAPATLMPDFRLVAPPDLPLAELWTLESFADLASCDVVLTYSVNKHSIYRGLKDGLRTEKILHWLDHWTGRELSQNVRYTIESWGETYGRIEFLDVLLLRCKSSELAAELQAIPEIARHVKGQVTDKDLIVDREGYDELVDLLETLDYLPKPLGDDAPRP